VIVKALEFALLFFLAFWAVFFLEM